VASILSSEIHGRHGQRLERSGVIRVRSNKNKGRARIKAGSTEEPDIVLSASSWALPHQQPVLKGTSPSPNIQRGNDEVWNSWHQHGNKDPNAALADKHTDNPKKVGGSKKYAGGIAARPARPTFTQDSRFSADSIHLMLILTCSYHDRIRGPRTQLEALRHEFVLGMQQRAQNAHSTHIWALSFTLTTAFSMSCSRTIS
jgi:hypothetical protein